MATIAEQLTQLQVDKETLKTNLTDKGIEVLDTDTFTEMSTKVAKLGPPVPEKGVIINEYDSDGYPIDISIVGMTTIPYYYLECNGSTNNSGVSIFQRTKNINFPDGLTNIGMYAFNNCKGLEMTSLPETLRVIDSYAFDSCTNLALTSLPSGLTNISMASFRGTKITLTELPSGITSIGTYAFSGCTELALTSLPEGVTSIGDSAFSSSKISLTELPSGLTKLSQGAFSKCANLTLTSIPTGITTLATRVFEYCTGLTYLELHEGITSIGSFAFNNCTNLTKLVVRATTPPTLHSNGFYQNSIVNGTGYIYVPDESIETYKTADVWSTYASQIKGISELEV